MGRADNRVLSAKQLVRRPMTLNLAITATWRSAEALLPPCHSAISQIMTIQQAECVNR
jgi:hypothetical protein